MFTIKVRNFQSLSEADIQLEDGLTIITGATNNGKSAIVRAVQSAIFNDGVDDYIKSGTDGLSVYLANDNHNVEYNRKAKGRTDKTTYQFDNGEIQQKVGRNQLPEMEKLFNIREVRLQNNQKARLNFWEQNEKPFLMDKTAGQLYEFLSVSSSEKYLNVLRSMMSDMKIEDGEIKSLTISIDTLKKELGIKQDILDHNQNFSILFDKISSAKKIEESIKKAEEIKLSMSSVEEVSNIVKESLRRVDEQVKLVPMEEVSSKMLKFMKKAEEIKGQEKLLSDTMRLHDRLEVLMEKMNKTVSLETKATEVINDLQNRIKSVLLLQEQVSAMNTKEEAFWQSVDKVKVCRAKIKELPATVISSEQILEIQKEIESIEEKTNWLSERRKETVAIMSVGKELKGLQKAQNDLQAVLKQSDEELYALKDKLGVCPFCGAVFNEKHNCI